MSVKKRSAKRSEARSTGASTEAVTTTTSAALTRQERIAREAYRRAERRNFTPGSELDDWLAAERSVDSELTELRTSSGKRIER